jgi:hypothetical protein
MIIEQMEHFIQLQNKKVFEILTKKYIIYKKIKFIKKIKFNSKFHLQVQAQYTY